MNSLWLVVAGLCVFALAYRYYGAFLAAKVMTLDDTHTTPARPHHHAGRRGDEPARLSRRLARAHYLNAGAHRSHRRRLGAPLDTLLRTPARPPEMRTPVAG